LRPISPVLGLARGASRIEPQREQEDGWARTIPEIISPGGLGGVFVP
jgi:hypothetical protein